MFYVISIALTQTNAWDMEKQMKWRKYFVSFESEKYSRKPVRNIGIIISKFCGLWLRRSNVVVSFFSNVKVLLFDEGAQATTTTTATRTSQIAVITVEPAGKASFVLGCIQRRLMGQYNAK